VAAQYVLPPRHRADELLSHYWETHHPIFPAVSRSDFLRDFELIYAGTVAAAAAEDTHRMIYCMANLMFAIAERSMPPNTSQGDGSSEYFETAKKLLHFDIFGNFSFSLLQALVLSAQYLQSTEKPRQCWAIVGFGITTAQSIGLHLPEAMDNMRPESDGRLALSVWNCHRKSQHLGDSMLFAQSCRLFDVLHETLNLLYNEGPEVAPVIDIIGHSSRLEKELERWTQELPPQLRLDGGKESRGHAYFLRQRYLQVRIILMRPGLLHFIKTSTTTAWDLEQATTWYCANQSVEAAVEMAEISAQTHPNATPWWYQLQYCYNAGVTLMAARLSERLTEGSRIQKPDAGISNCALAIEACSFVSPTASRCLSMFESVASRLGREASSGGVDEEAQTEGDSQSRESMNPMFSWDESWPSLWTDNAFYPMNDQPWEDLLSLI